MLHRTRRFLFGPDAGDIDGGFRKARGLELAFAVEARLGPLEDHGLTRAGHRRVIPIVSGRVTGLFEAELVPGGADWQTATRCHMPHPG